VQDAGTGSVILSRQEEIAAHMADGAWGHLALDELFLASARKAPERTALIDPPNRGAFTDGAPRRLSFAAAGAAVEALAERFSSLGLAEDDAVAVQLPNTVEAYLVLLGLFRARLIACPVPTPWREHDLKLALSQVAPRALITAVTIDGHAHAEMMRRVAGEQFSVRHVLAFGAEAPDGVVCLDAALEGDADPGKRLPRHRSQAADHVATVSFEADGATAPRPVPRSHNQLIAAALVHIAAAEISRDDVILTPYPPTGLLPLAACFGPWVLTGATLALHQPFDARALAESLRESTYTILPPGLLAALSAGRALSPARGALKRVGCAWPAPYLARDGASSPSRAGDVPIIDLYIFGEAATLALPRAADTVAGRIPLGRIRLGPNDGSGPVVLEARIQGGIQKAAGGPALAGSLQVRGAMVPSGPFAPPGGRFAKGGEAADAGGGGFVATGVRARICMSDPPSADCLERDRDVIHLGHSALSAPELDRLLRRHSGIEDAAVYAVPDPLLGERLEAAVVPVKGANISVEDLRAYFLSRKVAAHKVPDRAVPVDAIPREESGRVARALLARPPK
jgi:non-ribosomal peptide synthetase component E (peptide arylation enzyme)